MSSATTGDWCSEASRAIAPRVDEPGLCLQAPKQGQPSPARPHLGTPCHVQGPTSPTHTRSSRWHAHAWVCTPSHPARWLGGWGRGSPSQEMPGRTPHGVQADVMTRVAGRGPGWDPHVAKPTLGALAPADGSCWELARWPLICTQRQA